MLRRSLTLLGTLAGLWLAGDAFAQRPPARPEPVPPPAQPADKPIPATPEYFSNVRNELANLIREVEYLQEDIVDRLPDARGRGLYRKAQSVLYDLNALQTVVRKGVPKAQLQAQYEKIDLNLHELLKGVRDLAPNETFLLRDAGRVDAADGQMHFTVFGGDTSEDRVRQMLLRQAAALALAARELDQTARYAMAPTPNREMAGHLKDLIAATDNFRKSLESNNDRMRLQKDFADVVRAWGTTTRVFTEMAPRENAFLLYSAGRFDRHFERVFRLLGMTGERPRLIIRS